MAPTDEKIQERIETIESVLINSVRETEDSSNTTTTTTITTTTTATLELSHSSTSSTVIKKSDDDVEEVEEQRKEQLRCIIEDSLINYPRVTHPLIHTILYSHHTPSFIPFLRVTHPHTLTNTLFIHPQLRLSFTLAITPLIHILIHFQTLPMGASHQHMPSTHPLTSITTPYHHNLQMQLTRKQIAGIVQHRRIGNTPSNTIDTPSHNYRYTL